MRWTVAGVLGFALALHTASAQATVWAIDDGEKIKQDAVASPLATGEGNPVWAPGQSIRLFAMKNETVSVQIVVGADAGELTNVTVDLDSLTSESSKIQNAPGATDPLKLVGRPIERFVEHFFVVPRASGGVTANESLGWVAGSGPAALAWTGKIPDALIPVEIAPPWSPYPMTIAAGNNGIVWIDITVPKSQAAGHYKGNVVVKSAAKELATLPISLDVVDITLPDVTTKTMAFYDTSNLDQRIGAPDAEKNLFLLLHRHRISPMHSVTTTNDVTRQLSALDGSLYTAANGYEGPGEGAGDGIVSIGSYGKLGEPDATKLGVVETIADLMQQKGVLEKTDTFVYAIDEDCGSTWGATWKTLLTGSSNANVKKVRVGWTCSADATKQPVDIVMQLHTFDAAKTKTARAAGKEVWVYNGMLPYTGAFLTDTPAISPRVDGWLTGMFDVGRWFYWETTFWYDGNRGGKGPYDPFITAETFHNQHGDWAMGDGVLLYPGKQIDRFTDHSLGVNGVIPSIRLKNWRRGIQDAGYLQLARNVDAAKTDAIAKALLPAVFSEAKAGKPASWSQSGKPFFDARKALLAVLPGGDKITEGPDGGSGNAPPSERPKDSEGGCLGCTQAGRIGTGAVIAVGVMVFFFLARNRRRT
jgi:hypothetical protein